MLKFSLKLVFLASLLFIISCDDDSDSDDAPSEMNIVELAQSNDDLSMLVSAVIRADLATTLSSGNFTVFAPNNSAFETLLASNDEWDSIEDIPVETLTNVLLFHTLNGMVKSGDLTNGYVPTSLEGIEGSFVSLRVDADQTIFNMNADLVTADLSATNGVVHVIDKVMIPPTVADLAVANQSLSTLVSALTFAGNDANYAEVLSQAGEFTVFAPTNDAFAQLLEVSIATNLEELNGSIDLDVLLPYHVAESFNMSGKLTNGMEITTIQGQLLTVDIDQFGEVSLIDANNQKVGFVATDIYATNGVVHVINGVVQPRL